MERNVFKRKIKNKISENLSLENSKNKFEKKKWKEMKQKIILVRNEVLYKEKFSLKEY